MNLEVIETDRLLLKKYTPESLRDLFHTHSEARIIEMLGLHSHDEFLKEKHKAEEGYKTYDRTIVSIFLVLKETNETIGRSGFHNWYAAHRRAELGYVMSKEHAKRKGYMSEAVRAILDFGFKEMDLNRVEAYIGPDNIPSLSIVQKFGFTREGYLKQHYINDGVIHDSIIFSLLKEEYEAQRKDT